MGWKTVLGAVLLGVGTTLSALEDAGVLVGGKAIAAGLQGVGGALGLYGLRSAIANGGAKLPIAILGLWLALGATQGMAQDAPPAISVEGGVASFENPQAQFGMLLGQGQTRSYSRFAYQSDGTARQVETGVERVIFEHPRFTIVSRALAGIAQSEANTSGTVAGQFGFIVPIRWGFSLAALGEAGNAPIREGEWRGNPLLLLRWKP